MVKLENVKYKEGGHTIQYLYKVKGKAKKYFNEEDPFFTTYEEDISNCPESIATIPFVANFLPIAWFAGFDLHVDQLDEDYFMALQSIRSIFQQNYPDHSFKGRLVVKQRIKNTLKGDRSALLFSGGIDAFATYLRIKDKNPILATVHGADIELKDTVQWNNFRAFLDSESFLSSNEKTFIGSNLRTFYTYRVQLMLKDIGWWGKIQHGLALIGSLAPLSYTRGISEIYIASSYTKAIDISWGSTPEIDNITSWGGIKVNHDGYELKRQDKVDLIAEYARDHNTPFRLRVCYSERRKGFNCNQCEKCYRTILGLILAGQNPNQFGFEVNARVYDDIIPLLQGEMSSRGMRYFWWELVEKSKGDISPFIFDDQESERELISQISKIDVDYHTTKKVSKWQKLRGRYTFILTNRFNRIYNIYHRIKHNK